MVGREDCTNAVKGKSMKKLIALAALFAALFAWGDSAQIEDITVNFGAISASRVAPGADSNALAEASAHVAVTNGDPHGVLPQANMQIASALAAYGATGSVYKVQDTASNLLYMAMQNGLQITYRLDITNMYVVFSDDFAYNGVSPGVKTNAYPFTGLNGFNSRTVTNAPCEIFYPDSAPIWYSSGPTIPAVCTSHYVSGTGIATVYANYKATPIATNALQSWVDSEIMTKVSPQTYTYYGDFTYTNIAGYAAITSTNGADKSYLLVGTAAGTNTVYFRRQITDGSIISATVTAWLQKHSSSASVDCTLRLYTSPTNLVAENTTTISGVAVFPEAMAITNSISYAGSTTNGFLEIAFTGRKSADGYGLVLYTGPSKPMTVASYKAPITYATRDELLAVKSSSSGLTTNDVDARVALGVATLPIPGGNVTNWPYYTPFSSIITPAGGTATVSVAAGFQPSLTITSPTVIQLDPAGFPTTGVCRVSLNFYSGTNAVTFATNVVTYATTPTVSTSCWNTILFRRAANCIWRGAGL